MANTLLRVCYRNAHNDKNSTEVILTGPPRLLDITDVIAPTLVDGAFFIPRQVGLPDAHFDNWNWCGEDHPYHTFGCRQRGELHELIEPTERPTTLAMSWSELVARFAAIRGWDPEDWPGRGTAADVPLGVLTSEETL
jgi:hypothetical protein